MQEVVRGTFSALIIKVLGALLAFTFNIVLARILGADGAGIYFLALSVTTIASVISRVGLDNTLLRFIAAYSSENKWKEVKGVYFKAFAITIPLSILITIIVEIISSPLATYAFGKQELIIPLRWMALAILPLSLLSLYAEMLKGLNRIPASLSLQSIFIPLINLLAITFLASKTGAAGGGVSYFIATLLTAFLGLWFWYKSTPQILSIQGIFDWHTLKRSCMPNYGAAILHKAVLPWLPLILLGFWSTSVDVGLFSAASRTALLVSFILHAVNSVAAPKFAALHLNNDLLALGKLARKITRLTMIVASPLILVMVIFPAEIMSIFGSEYKQAWLLLIILVSGQFISVLFGSVGYLLIMTGNESLQRNSIAISALSLIFLLIILVPSLGTIGAAIASSLFFLIYNVISYFYVRKHLGFSTL